MTTDVGRLVSERHEARKRGDFDTADRIRNELFICGIVLEDTINETSWKRAETAAIAVCKPQNSSLNNRKIKQKKKRQRNRDKKHRFQIFADWIIETYGRAHLTHGIIDVAGGKGRMAIELALHRNLPAVQVVDPNISMLSRYTSHKIARLAAQFPEPHFMNEYLHPLIQYLDPNVRENCNINQVSLFLDQLGVDFHQSLFDQEYCTKLQPEKWTRASLVIGMHPDEATEAIVDAALASGKAFAVIPCCVFPSLFPDRLLNNKPVRQLSEFIAYLQAKDPRIQIQTLESLAGCNTIVYLKT